MPIPAVVECVRTGDDDGDAMQCTAAHSTQHTELGNGLETLNGLFFSSEKIRGREQIMKLKLNLSATATIRVLPTA